MARRSRAPSGSTSAHPVKNFNRQKVHTISKLSGKALKRKGDTYERDLARWFNTKLFGGTERVTRAPLSGGGYTSLNAGGADLIGLPLVFVEAKRVEKLNIREALRQAINNTEKRQTPDVPVVITRRSNEKMEDSIVAFRLRDFTDMLEIVYRSQGYIKNLELDESPVDDDDLQMSFLPDA